MSDKFTVAQLIGLLAQMPQEAEVICQYNDYDKVYSPTANIHYEPSEHYEDGRQEVYIELINWEGDTE